MSEQNAPESTPPRPAKARRTVRLEVRLTPDEETQVETMATEAGATVSDFVRARILSQPVRRSQATPDRKRLIEALGQLGKVGSNLNQLAHHANAGHYERIGSLHWEKSLLRETCQKLIDYLKT